MVRWARSPLDAALVLVAAARELGHDPDHLRPLEALAAWTAAAQVPFRVPAVPEADGLLYRFGTVSEDGVARFRLTLLRRFVCRDGHGQCEVQCDVDVATTPELAALGEHAEWCYAPPSSPARHTWTTALAERPEWRALEQAADVRVSISGVGPAPEQG